MTRHYLIGGVAYPETNGPAGAQGRPVVVIDPEDREAVERLALAINAQYGSNAVEPVEVARVQAALREFADPKPPKPDEPTGLGAVVEDANGRRWVRVNETLQAYWRPSDASSGNSFRNWSGIHAVRVLSEGVAL